MSQISLPDILPCLVTKIDDGIYQIELDQPLTHNSTERHILMEITDNRGNIKRADLRFFTSDLIFER